MLQGGTGQREIGLNLGLRARFGPLLLAVYRLNFRAPRIGIGEGKWKVVIESMKKWMIFEKRISRKNEIEVDAGEKLVFDILKMKNHHTLQSLGFRKANDFIEKRFTAAIERNLRKEFWNNEEALTNLAFKIFPSIQKREI